MQHAGYAGKLNREQINLPEESRNNNKQVTVKNIISEWLIIFSFLLGEI